MIPINTFDLFSRIMALLNTATWLDDAEVHLFQNDILITPETILSDLVEADYTGYAMQTVTATPIVYLGPDGNYIAQYPHKVFQPTGTAISNTLYGYWIEGTFGGTGVRLGWAARFDTPVIFTGPEDAQVVEPRFIIGQPTVA